MIIEGYCCLYNKEPDSHNEVFLKGAFAESIITRPVLPILRDHDLEQVVGHSIELTEDDKGLFIKALLYKNRYGFPLLKGGRLGLSVCFTIKEHEVIGYGELSKIRKAALSEVSVSVQPTCDTWVEKFTYEDKKGATKEVIWNNAKLAWEHRNI